MLGGFQNQEAGGRGPPLKNNPQNWSVFGVLLLFLWVLGLETTHCDKETPTEGGYFSINLNCGGLCVCCFVLLNRYWGIQGPLRECRSIRSGAFGLSYYCTTPVTVPTILGGLAVWRYNTKNKKGNHYGPGVSSWASQGGCMRQMRECRSIWSGFCGLPSYYAPLVCVPAVICVRSCCNWRASCMAAYQQKKSKKIGFHKNKKTKQKWEG